MECAAIRQRQATSERRLAHLSSRARYRVWDHAARNKLPNCLFRATVCACAATPSGNKLAGKYRLTLRILCAPCESLCGSNQRRHYSTWPERGARTAKELRRYLHGGYSTESTSPSTLWPAPRRRAGCDENGCRGCAGPGELPRLLSGRIPVGLWRPLEAIGA